MESVDLKRFIVFGLVGISGILVNTGILWLLSDGAGLPYFLSSPIAIQVAILNNYIWNRWFTWRDRLGEKGNRPFWRTLFNFTLVSWIAGAFNWALLLAFTELLGVYYLISNLIAIAIASLVNYFANDLWTFRSIAPSEKLRD